MFDTEKLLSQKIEMLENIGPAKAVGLNRLGIFDFFDLLWYFPRRYEDRRIKQLDNLNLHDTCCVCMKITRRPSSVNAKGFKILKFTAAEVKPERENENEAYTLNPTGRVMDVVYFNSDYLKNAFTEEKVYLFYGRLTGDLVKFEMVNPKHEPFHDDGANLPFYPVYRKNSSVTQNIIVKSVLTLFRMLEGNMEELEPIPDRIRLKHNLCHIGFALRNIHLPENENNLKIARERLIFDDFFFYSLVMHSFKKRREKIPYHIYDKAVSMEEFYGALPFKLTNAQQKAVGDILSDMTGSRPMSRLVQGDVGSGKTIIAAAAAFFAAKNGTQAVMMAPTDILATQHYEGLCPLFAKWDIEVRLLTGSLKAKEKRAVLDDIRSGAAQFVIGTHAVIQRSVEFKKLSLSITDEQHRFGVNQRAVMEGKAEFMPHTLVMSATPIPRTLALIMYGDLDVSIVNELPPGRQKIDTFAVNESYRQRIQNFIRKQIEAGGLVFIVCPLVGEDGEEEQQPIDKDARLAGMRSVTAYYKELSEKIFPDIPLGFMHGRIKAEEKDVIMEKFKNHEIKILVSTIVIEVGVNIPDATLMVIENAERFGLSQLHQLRGRVGRGSKKSYCVLFSDSENETTRQRLDIMCKTNDGFEIARKDIEIRGPGDLVGEKQSGEVKFKIADLATDTEILYLASETAKSVIADDPELEKAENYQLKTTINKIFSEEERGKIAFN